MVNFPWPGGASVQKNQEGVVVYFPFVFL